MTEKIGSFPRPGTETKPTGSQSSGSTQRARTETHSETQTTAGHDAVSLTDTFTRLKSIEARIEELPEIDRERVEELRRQIDSGEFKVDPQLIARRLVQLEQALSQERR